MTCDISQDFLWISCVICSQYVSREDQTLLLAHASVAPQVHWQSTMAGKPVTDVATSVYASKSTSNPQCRVDVLLTPVLWLLWCKLIIPQLPAGCGELYMCIHSSLWSTLWYEQLQSSNTLTFAAMCSAVMPCVEVASTSALL